MFSRPVASDDESEMLLMQTESATLLTHVAASQQQLISVSVLSASSGV
jgi:hypothetical protein